MFEDAPASMEEIEEDIFVRRLIRRRVDGRVVGFAIMNFSKYNLDELPLPFKVKVLPVVPALAGV